MSLRALLKLAYAETRRSQGKLLFCVFSIAVGVGSLTAVRTAILSLENSIAAQSKTLMGADLMFRSNAPVNQGVAAELSGRLQALGARAAAVTELNSMLVKSEAAADVPQRVDGAAAGNDSDALSDTQMVQIRAVSGGFPFYGEIETDPPEQWSSLAGERPVLIADESILEALSLKTGDRVTLGGQAFEIRAVFLKKPGRPTSGFSFAPAVYIHQKHLAGTGLIQYGSRVRYHALFELPANIDPREFKSEHFAAAIDEGVTITTYHESAEQMQRFLFRLSHFLTMVGLITLLLGGLGIGSAMFVFIKAKLDHAAILRSMGARPGQVFLIYFALAAMLGLTGSLLGLIPGSVLPILAAQAATASGVGADLLPVELDIQFSWIACLQGASAGVIATLLFTLYPVYRIRRVSPLRVLRRMDEAETSEFRWRDLLVLAGGMLAIFLFVLLLTVTQTNSFTVAFAFTGAIAAALLLLTLASRLVVYITRRVIPRIGNYHLKQGVANLYRPGNQTAAVITAVGIGVLLISSVFILEASIQSEIAVEDRDDLPNLFVINVQANEIEGVLERVRASGGEEITSVPMVSARIQDINGVVVDRKNVERNAVERTWNDRVRTREYFISYREKPAEFETITAGKFWDGRPAEQEISVDEDWAERMDVELGDRMTLTVEGRPIQGVVTSFRQIEWQALRPNSMLLLSPGRIEAVPPMYATSFRVADPSERTRFQSRLVRAYPNASVIDVTEAASNVRLILGQVSAVISFLAAITMLNGVIILGGAIAAGRFARLKESMLLKVLGASRSDLRRILISEYAILAALGCLCGWVLAESINRPLLAQFFEAPTVVPYATLLAIVAGIVGLNVGIGLFISRDVARTKPLVVLRDPGS
ncbi:MAG: FtsX-like permease family protein [Leptospirales bacterium]|jgi:putative ABC transport system permease protein